MRERLAGLGHRGLLVLIVVAAFLMRTAFLWSAVFTTEGVNFQDSDAWYHMRLIENLARNYPHRAVVDPYLAADAPVVAVPLLFDLFVSGVAWLVGLASPAPRTIELLGALVPPVLGALTTLPVYLIGERLFDRRVGLLAAGLLAIAPGQFLARSVLGFTDHHVAEALLTSLTMLAAIRAIQADETRPRALGGVLTGVALSAYLLAWSGGALLVFVLCAWGVVQYVLDDARREREDHVALVLLPALAVAVLTLLLLQDRGQWRFAIQMTAVVAALAVIVTLAGAHWGLRRVRAPAGVLAALLVVLVGGGLVAFRVLAPDLTSRIMSDLARFRPGSGTTGFTVSEVRPLLLMTGRVSLLVPFVVFGPAFYVALAALGWLAWRAVQTASPALVLFVTWSALMFVATLGQNRFGYYLALNLALLTGWACGLALKWAWTPPRRTRSRAAARRGRGRIGERHAGRLWLRVASVAAVVALVFLPSALLARPIASHNLGLAAGYHASLDWLRRNTPDPFSRPDYYYARYRPGQTLTPSYTVMAWWDYGYEIIRLGRRVPVANPTQAGATTAGRFFTSADEGEAVQILDQTRTRYVITHAEVPILPRGNVVQGKFETMVAWAGKDIGRYWETFLTKDQDGRLGPLVLFHPEYYQTIMVRLYVFGGAAAVPKDSTYVITYAERANRDGTRSKEILESRRFKTYEAAAAYLERQGHAGRAIVGLDPKQTPVPLEPLTRFRLLHESPIAPPAVRIFEYLGFLPDGAPRIAPRPPQRPPDGEQPDALHEPPPGPEPRKAPPARPRAAEPERATAPPDVPAETGPRASPEPPERSPDADKPAASETPQRPDDADKAPDPPDSGR
jgi:dolichyl-phosphooligosaccharide-protein glycotransferase